jgi:hypothetical protein
MKCYKSHRHDNAGKWLFMVEFVVAALNTCTVEAVPTVHTGYGCFSVSIAVFSNWTFVERITLKLRH